MHLKYLLFWGILGILITGCQSEPTELNLQATHKPSNGYTTRVLSVEEAYDNALPLINQKSHNDILPCSGNSRGCLS